MFHLSRNTRECCIKWYFFMPYQAFFYHFPINNRSNVSDHSFRLYGMSDLSTCVDGLAIANIYVIYLYPIEDGEMNEMTLPYRHRIRNTSPRGLRPSTQSRRFSIISNLNANKMMRLWKLIVIQAVFFARVLHVFFC